MKIIFLTFIACIFLCTANVDAQTKRPNILILMSDNQFWSHNGIYGDNIVKTPNIDGIARHGVRFTHAFCASPSCTPSRAGLLTGQDIWRLEEGGNLWGTLSKRFKVYTDLLEENGYDVGFHGKGWGPGEYATGGRKRNPAGNRFESFGDFLNANKTNGKPWTYWFSSHEPHRPYVLGSGVKVGIDISKIHVPSYLPDNDSVRQDIADYYAAIETFDTEIGGLIDTLKKSGSWNNTVIVICSDNGWQMPRGLANLYDFGTRVPLIFSYAGWSQKERVYEDFVNLNDLAPTFLQLANVTVPKEMTAVSLVPILQNNTVKGQIDQNRNEVFMARERHAFVRQDGKGYPGRAIRTKDFLYIHNVKPAYWPAGDPPLYGDVDANNLHYPSLTKVNILVHAKDTIGKKYYEWAFDKRPEEELYDLRTDPDQLTNVAYSKEYRTAKEQLSKKLNAYLKKTKDPRVVGGTDLWDTYPYYEEKDKTPKPSVENQKALHLLPQYNYISK